MSLPPHDQSRLRRRPRALSRGGPGGSATSSARPTSHPRTESMENVPSLSPTVSPPALPMRERCSTTSPAPLSPAVSWQIPSCSRCMVCKRIGCESCSVRVDPAATKQKLDSLRLNTPYERAKLARSTDELLSEEGRQRQRLVSRYEAWLEGLYASELVERHLVRIVLQEGRYRQQLCQAEGLARAACVSAADFGSVLVNVQLSEAAARQATMAQEREQFAELRWQGERARHLVQLLQRESMTRAALSYSESSLRDRLRVTEAESRSGIAEFMRERQRFGQRVLQTRDEVVREWQAGIENLYAAAVAHRELIAQHVHQRGLLLRAAEQGKRDVVAEEAAARGRVREEMAEEADYLAAWQRITARQWAAFFKSEAEHRQGICTEAEGGYHVIFIEMKADADDVCEALAQKASRRHDALLFALDTLCTIQHEEHAAFEALMQRERSDAAGRQAWIAHKAEVRSAFVEQCWQEKIAVVPTEEAAARAALRKAFADGEVAVAQLLAGNARAREELSRHAVAALHAIFTEEHDARFQLMSEKAAHEEGVRQWCEAKRASRAAVLEQEHAQRCCIVQQEDVCRQAVCSSRAKTTAAIEERAAQHRQARTRALAAAVEALSRVAEEEQAAWAVLCAAASDDSTRAVALTHFRCQMELMQTETQRRAQLAQAEVVGRAEVQTKMTLAARYVAEAAMAALRVQLCSVVSAEESARCVFYEHVGEWYDYVAAQQREEELRLIVALEQQIRDELRARQSYMTEDARLYTDEEPLPFRYVEDGDEGEVMARHGSRLGSSGDGVHDVRRAVVLQTLGNPVCATALSGTAVDFLVVIIDRAGRCRDSAQESFAAAEREARDASRRLIQCERLFVAEKEKKEMYEVSARREAEERERRLHGEGLDKSRSQQSIAAEKRRLAEVQAELREQQSVLETLKNSINKQFSR